ncbi:hypothetical protein MUU74_01300 [Chryseobacterium daecheongense]|uniref:transposase n=1 Tax=Chryseobacterium daecheongense TaxID=192389 RepID=UPI001FD64CF8|nr:transposase [Chryseobacterium daecheongense]UOU98617.1 hypothetical protein MUU74_01300 [Chryseobacterium daecheongense]
MQFKNIHIGSVINQRVEECKMGIPRICSFFKRREEEIEKMYQAESLDSELLLRWSKLLDYDFFRIYSQHLILYSPQTKGKDLQLINRNLETPHFRKNIYTKELIDFILELLKKQEKTITQVIDEYRIPKSTLYRWIKKY